MVAISTLTTPMSPAPRFWESVAHLGFLVSMHSASTILKFYNLQLPSNTIMTIQRILALSLLNQKTEEPPVRLLLPNKVQMS